MILLYIDLETEWRGGQNQALLTLRGLRALGHPAELVAARGCPLARRAMSEGIPTHTVGRHAMRAQATLLLRRLLRQRRFDLLHANEPHALTAAWLARAHRRLPLLLSRRIGFPLQENPISQARYRAVRQFVANCHDVAQSLVNSGVPADRIVIVNEGVEVPPPPSPEMRRYARARWGVEESMFLFGCVGFLLPEKGQKYLIQAMAQVRVEFPQSRLLLAGDGPCRGELQRLAQQLGQTEAVRFAGFVEDVSEVYAALDAFLFPSLFEGLGTSLQSAMAWGLPVVSTARGGLAEVVEEGRTGIVVEPGEREFSGAMLRLLRDNPLRQRLGQAARKDVEQRFSAARMVENTCRAYENVCAEGMPR